MFFLFLVFLVVFLFYFILGGGGVGGQPVKYMVIGTRPNFPYLKYGGYRKASQIGKTFKHSTAEFQQLQPQKNKINTKNADMRLWGDARRDQKPDFFLGGGGMGGGP